jgi:hypothetical protein
VFGKCFAASKANDTGRLFLLASAGWNRPLRPNKWSFLLWRFSLQLFSPTQRDVSSSLPSQQLRVALRCTLPFGESPESLGVIGHLRKVAFRIKWLWLVWLALPCAAPGVARATLSTLVYHIQTVAGSGHNGDGGPAAAAEIGNIQGLTFDSFGNLYLTDTDHHRVRKISPAGIITTFAGTGSAGLSGDGGPAIAAQLNLP